MLFLRQFAKKTVDDAVESSEQNLLSVSSLVTNLIILGWNHHSQFEDGLACQLFHDEARLGDAG